MADKELSIVVSAKNMASKVLKDVEKSTVSLRKELKTVAKATAVAAVALGTVAVNESRKFEKSMSNVSTLIDTTTESMEDMKNEVLDMSKKLPVGIDDLSSSLYDVRSAGISAHKAMRVLRKSAKLGVAGLGTTKQSVDLVTSSMNSFGVSAEEAADIIQLTVKSGKTNISELAQSFGNVAGVAKSAGISFKELQAATAALTTTGQKASVAQTQLRSAMLAIQAPSKDMNTLISSMGYKSGEAMLNQLGLVGSMEAVSDAANGNTETLKKAYGSVEALGASISLTGEQSNAFSDIMNQMKDSAGALDEAFKKQNATFDAQFLTLKNKLTVVMIELGNKIIPVLLEVMKWLEENSDKVETALKILSVTIAVLVESVKIAINILYSLGEAFGHVIVYLVDTLPQAFDYLSEKIKYTMEAIWYVITESLNAIYSKTTSIFNSIKVFIQNALNSIKQFFIDISSGIPDVWGTMLEGMGEKVNSIFDKIKQTISSSINWMIQKINKLIYHVNSISSKVGVPNIPHIPDIAFANGGVGNFGFGAGITNGPVTGLAGESGPEAIVPLPNGRSIPVDMKGGGQSITVNLTVQGSVQTERSLTQSISEALANGVFRQGTMA